MADNNRMEGLQTALSNPRARLGLAVMAAIAVVTIVLLMTFVGGDDVGMASDLPPPATPSSSMIAPMEGDPLYDAAVAQVNQEGVTEARMDGGSFIPAPRAATAAEVMPAIEAPAEQGEVMVPQAVVEYGDPAAFQMRQEEIRAAEEAHRQAVQAHAERMAEQVSLLSQRWRGAGGHFSLDVESPDAPIEPDASSAPGAQRTSGATFSSSPLALRGDMHLGVTIGELVSDDAATHAQAMILSGPLAGSQLFGSLEANLQGGAASGTIAFDSLRLPGGATTLPIKAIAVNPATRRANTVGDVDRHTFSRIGATALGAATGAYAEALSQGGRNENLVTGGLGDAVVQRDAFTDGQIARIAGARTLQSVGADIASRANRPPTITIANGTEIGILWLEDVAISAAAYQQETVQ